MPESIRLWSVADGDTLHELSRQTVDFEARLEDWMHADISVLSDDLLVIGRQLDTQGGGTLDLLCIDSSGDLVVVELKRGKTPRDVVAQALDYGAWVSGLSYDDVVGIGNREIGDIGLAAAFLTRFGSELPEVLNDSHQLMVVSSEVDDRSERIIRYLNDTHGIAINAVKFNYLCDADGRELLARTHLIEPEVAEDRLPQRSRSKRRRAVTLEDHQQRADRQGVGELYRRLVDGLSRWRRPDSATTMVTFYFREPEGWIATFNVITAESDSETGLRFNAYKHRMGRVFELTPEEVRDALPATIEPWVYSMDDSSPGNDWSGYTGAFQSVEEVDHLVRVLAASSPPGV